MKKKKFFTLSLKRKEALSARIFVLPFCLGFILFSAKPLFETLIMAFSNVEIQYGGYAMNNVGLENMVYIFTKDPDFLLNLFTSVGDMLWQVPCILFISLFLATILNGKFKGRGFIRSVFFLPVIIVTGVIITIIQNDVVANAALEGGVATGGKIEYSVGLDTLLVDSGIQIVLFLAGLQSIPSSLYEASSVEGATKLDDFFKITIPMTIPIMLINTVYTIVDGFTDVNNKAMNQVLVAVNNLKYGTGAAMSWSYFVLIGIFIALIMLVFSKLSKKYS